MIKCRAPAGMRVKRCAALMVQTVVMWGDSVEVVFNGVRLFAHEETEAEQIINDYKVLSRKMPEQEDENATVPAKDLEWEGAYFCGRKFEEGWRGKIFKIRPGDNCDNEETIWISENRFFSHRSAETAAIEHAFQTGIVVHPEE